MRSKRAVAVATGLAFFFGSPVYASGKGHFATLVVACTSSTPDANKIILQRNSYDLRDVSERICGDSRYQLRNLEIVNIKVFHDPTVNLDMLAIKFSAAFQSSLETFTRDHLRKNILITQNGRVITSGYVGNVIQDGTINLDVPNRRAGVSLGMQFLQ